MSRQKILIINNGFAGGGIERASVSLANHFVDMGYKVSIVALYQSEHFFSLDKRIYFKEPQFTRKAFNKGIYVIKMLAFLRKEIKKIKPNTILAFGEWTNPYVILAAWGLNIPIYLTDRMNPMAGLPLVSSVLKKFLYKKAAGIIAQTEFAKRIISKTTHSSNVKVIYNPVNCINKINGIEKNIIVSVGRLSKEKGHEYLIKAFAEIKDKKWQLSLVGDGNQRKHLETVVSKLNIDDRVIFHGYLSDFTKQLSESRIFVLPSLTEGFPNALIEAMSVPLACISSDIEGGPQEIIKHEVNGLLVEPGNVKALASVLNRLIEKPDLRKKLASEAYKIRETLAFNKVASQYLKFILQQND